MKKVETYLLIYLFIYLLYLKNIKKSRSVYHYHFITTGKYISIWNLYGSFIQFFRQNYSFIYFIFIIYCVSDIPGVWKK